MNQNSSRLLNIHFAKLSNTLNCFLLARAEYPKIIKHPSRLNFPHKHYNFSNLCIYTFFFYKQLHYWVQPGVVKALLQFQPQSCLMVASSVQISALVAYSRLDASLLFNTHGQELHRVCLSPATGHFSAGFHVPLFWVREGTI